MKYLLSFLLIATVVGCGSGPAPDPKVEGNRVENAKKMREAYLRVNGNYDQLSASEKADFVKMFNGKESDAQQAWNFMKNQGVGPSGPSQPGPTSGPGG